MTRDRVNVVSGKIRPFFSNLPVFPPEVEVAILPPNSHHVGNTDGVSPCTVDEEPGPYGVCPLMIVNGKQIFANSYRFSVKPEEEFHPGFLSVPPQVSSEQLIVHSSVGL